MTNLKTEYKKEMNAFCDANCDVTAEDIIRMAQDKTHKTEEKVVSIKPRRRKKKIWKAVIPAACFLLMGTTVLAATGHLETLFRNIFKDEKTAEIVEQGYLYEVQQSKTEDIFKIDLVAVTGDAQTPILVFDVYVNDEELVANNDQIRILAYTLGVEQYEKELDLYAPNEAYGEKDAEIENLYHVSMTGAPVWMTSGEPVVVDVCQINFNLDDEIWKTYEVNMEYRFTPPADIYYPVTYNYYEDIKFSHGGIDYYLTAGEYGPYRTELRFEYDFEGTSLAGTKTDYAELKEELHANWLEFVSTLTLVVDGTEYKVDEENMGYTWCDESGGLIGKNHCNIHPYFPSMNYEAATSVVIKAGDTSFTLK